MPVFTPHAVFLTVLLDPPHCNIGFAAMKLRFPKIPTNLLSVKIWVSKRLLQNWRKQNNKISRTWRNCRRYVHFCSFTGTHNQWSLVVSIFKMCAGSKQTVRYIPPHLLIQIKFCACAISTRSFIPVNWGTYFERKSCTVFSRGWRGGCKRSTLDLMPTLRMSGAATPFPYLSSQRARGQLYLCLFRGEIVKLAGFTLLRINALLTNPKVKSNVLPAQVMQVYWGSRSTAAPTLNLCTIWRWVVNLTPWQIYPPRKNPGTHSIRSWVGPRAGLDVLRKRKISCLYRDSKSGPPNP